MTRSVEDLEGVEVEHAPDAAEDKFDTDEAVHVVDAYSEYAADLHDFFLDGNDIITPPTPSALPDPDMADVIDVESEVHSSGWAGRFDYSCLRWRSMLAITAAGFNAPHEKAFKCLSERKSVRARRFRCFILGAVNSIG